ncbi:MAG TPA: hypothetical protein VGC88_05905 [Terriglobales bacterium]
MKTFLCAISMVASLTLAHAQSQPHRPPRAGSEPIKRVNVVIHGEIAWIVSKDRLTLYMTRTPEHVQVAGTFGGKLVPLRGVSRVEGLQPGQATPDAKRFAYIEPKDCPDLKVDPRQVVARVELPVPDAITPFRSRALDKGKLFNGEGCGGKIQAESVPLVVVFSYNVSGTRPPRLLQNKRVLWTATVTNAPDTANLHIYSEVRGPRDESYDRQHSQEVVDSYNRLLPPLKLKLLNVEEYARCVPISVGFDKGPISIRVDELRALGESMNLKATPCQMDDRTGKADHSSPAACTPLGGGRL